MLNFFQSLENFCVCVRNVCILVLHKRRICVSDPNLYMRVYICVHICVCVKKDHYLFAGNLCVNFHSLSMSVCVCVSVCELDVVALYWIVMIDSPDFLPLHLSHFLSLSLLHSLLSRTSFNNGERREREHTRFPSVEISKAHTQPIFCVVTSQKKRDRQESPDDLMTYTYAFSHSHPWSLSSFQFSLSLSLSLSHTYTHRHSERGHDKQRKHVVFILLVTLHFLSLCP